MKPHAVGSLLGTELNRLDFLEHNAINRAFGNTREKALMLATAKEKLFDCPLSRQEYFCLLTQKSTSEKLTKKLTQKTWVELELAKILPVDYNMGSLNGC